MHVRITAVAFWSDNYSFNILLSLDPLINLGIAMRELLQKFENKSPEIVFEWKDSETEAEGWVVINSLRGGAAGGGTLVGSGDSAGRRRVS